MITLLYFSVTFETPQPPCLLRSPYSSFLQKGRGSLLLMGRQVSSRCKQVPLHWLNQTGGESSPCRTAVVLLAHCSCAGVVRILDSSHRTAVSYRIVDSQAGPAEIFWFLPISLTRFRDSQQANMNMQYQGPTEKPAGQVNQTAVFETNSKIDRSVKTPWQEYGVVVGS